jgi:titin
MANTTLTLACIGSAYADSELPSQNFHGASSYTFPAAYNSSRLYFKFEPFPEAYKRRVLQQAYVNAYWSGTAFTSATKLYSWQKACGDFDENTLTYNNSADDGETIGTTEFKTSIPNPVNIPEDTTIWGPAPFRAKKLLGKSCMYIEFADHTRAVTFNTQHASNKPALVVTFSDQDVEYQLKGVTKTSGFINRFESVTFSWTIQKAVSGDYCVADPKQASAVFHWRQGSSGNWNDIAINGQTNSVTVPPETFPGGEIQWNVTGVDDYGVALTAADTYTVTTLVGDLKAAPASPINGAFLDPSGAGIFRWTNTNAHNITTQTGADLQYSTDGTNWTDLGTVTGVVQSYVAPAGVFTAATYYWRVRAYNVDGVAGPWSSAAEFSTVDSTMYGAPAHPVYEIADYTEPITFEWTYSSNTGTIPQRTDLQTSLNGADWTDRAQLGAGVLSYTVAANTFAAGTVYWRVRCYNSNNVAGPWSSPVSFAAYGAPPQPSVSVDAVPFAVIRWQSSGQLAYKVTVDGVDLGTFFGTGKSYTMRDYLTDGEHTASISIQGAYGLWSQPGTITFTVENIPGDALQLTASANIDAVLKWTGGNNTGPYIVYRDGAQIAETAADGFTDRVVLGAHTWYVIELLPGGYYTKSNAVVKTCAICCPQIAPLSGGPWVAVDAARDPVVKVHHGRERALTHYRGLRLPVVEWGSFEDETVTINAVFECEEKAARFRELFGQTVIIKTYRNRVFVVALPAYDEDMELFHGVFNLTAESVDWGDFINAAGS